MGDGRRGRFALGRRRRQCGHAGFDDQDIARLHYVGEAPRCRPQFAVMHRTRPGHLRQGQGSGVQRGRVVRRIQPPDLRLGVGFAQDDRQLPGWQHARRPNDRREPCAPVGEASVQVRHRPAPAAFGAVVVHQPVAQRLFRRGLQRRIEAGPHHQALGVGVLAELGRQFAAHLLGEPVRAGNRRRAAEFRWHDRLRLRAGDLGRGDLVILGKAVQHIVAPRPGDVGEFEGIEVVRRLGQGRQERRLGDGELIERLVEIGLRRGGDAIGTLPEIDLVQVQLEDALLAQRLLDADRQDRFLHLARHRHLVVQQHVLGHLLGDGGGADRPAPLVHMCDVEDRGADDGQRIDAVMDVEILVLGRDEGLAHDRRDGRDRHKEAPFDGEFRQQPAVIGEHPAHDRRLVVAQAVHVRQVGAEMLPGHPAARTADDRRQRDHA